ncbi:protein CHROMATIN REMODELING 24 [Phalaenopsis equestris]|uniref:protein CHROMATIN REMODELING 24 n=1 Tax=Phalaenopsis equestris TaxID=78828 RepID=UPI0009E610A0|nr:protein CHROMATIN REMODELING 24 [Phalaenopsis equestris]
MAAEEGKPLSLNERLALSLTRSRTTSDRTTEIGVRKVKLDGRRRLCKLSSRTDGNVTSESSPGKKSDGGEGENFRDILDDLSSRLETLSVDKLNNNFMPVSHESEVEFKSAASSLSSSSYEEKWSEGIEKIKGKTVRPLVLEQDEVIYNKNVKGKVVERLVLDDDSDGEDCVVLGSGDEPKWGHIGDAVEEINVDCRDPIRMIGTGKCRGLRYTLPGKIVKMLFPHQREGLKWLWSLHCGGTGGILGDDMGLGKTMQISAFLAGLFHSSLINRVLVVAPKTLLSHWMKELSVVGLSSRIREYSGTSPKVREYELKSVLKEGGILLTTYDIVRNNSKSIRGDWYIGDDRIEDDIIWDYTILDEGHIIKNPQTQRAKSLFEIQSGHRIIVTGTPIQNNLKELWALFHFCCPEILGGKDEFKIKYENPILRGNDKHASDREKHIGSTVAKGLRERIKPYFLRRLKSEVFHNDDAVKNAMVSKKNEIIVWLKLTSVQRQLYEAFLESEMVHSSVSGSPLAAITILKKICDHPLLLTKRAAEGVLEGMNTMLNREELVLMEEMALNLLNSVNHNVFKMDQHISCKLSFIMPLLENLVKEGHHILIFSQTRKMLNLLEEAIFSKGYNFLRIDGTTKISDREKIVKDFQEGCGAPIFLLTSQVGGLGLTLTKADRVIVVDPAWNPSTDNQSVDRAYRIGQERDVLVYRLMTCGTVEEKIYKMQVFKGGLFRTATEQKEQTRYFSQRDIRELFCLPPKGFDISLTQQQLYEEHDQQHTMGDELKGHIEFLKSLGIAGVSHHSLLFSKTSTISFTQENSYSDSLTGNRIVQSSQSKPSIESTDHAAEFAFNPKDSRLFLQPVNSLPQEELQEKTEVIAERIIRLSQTLQNKALISNLPDQGEKLRKRVSDLKMQLEKSRDSTANQAFERKQHQVIDSDDLSINLQRIGTLTISP